MFEVLNPQDPNVGLTQPGYDLIQALFNNQIIVDITHASQFAQEQIFDLAFSLQLRSCSPIISSHNALQSIALERLPALQKLLV